MLHPVLSFLISYLRDLNLQCTITGELHTDLSVIDLGLRRSILNLTQETAARPLGDIEPNALYHITDYYGCSYSFLQLPGQEEYLFLGPYLLEESSEPAIRERMDELTIPPELFGQLQDYYFALPCFPQKPVFHSLLRHLLTELSGDDCPLVYELDLKNMESREDYLKLHEFIIPDDPILSMHLLETRYASEDALLDAVSCGNTAKALSSIETIGMMRISPRSGDEQRDFKNLMITLNTLLRRTAYVSGVHPLYIDAVSSNYARMIEQSGSIREASDIVPYMIKSYCSLVSQRSMSSYSEPVKQILVTVDASLAADLSLKRFSEELFLNPSYLSALFKKELGIPLTEYVNKNRIEYAKKLLKSTTLSIQDIAIQSGIPDLHYFTRLFKRETGVSPRTWRNSL